MNNTYNNPKYSKEFEREEEERKQEQLLIEADQYESIMQDIVRMQEQENSIL